MENFKFEIRDNRASVVMTNLKRDNVVFDLICESTWIEEEGKWYYDMVISYRLKDHPVIIHHKIKYACDADLSSAITTTAKIVSKDIEKTISSL